MIKKISLFILVSLSVITGQSVGFFAGGSMPNTIFEEKNLSQLGKAVTGFAVGLQLHKQIMESNFEYSFTGRYVENGLMEITHNSNLSGDWTFMTLSAGIRWRKSKNLRNNVLLSIAGGVSFTTLPKYTKKLTDGRMVFKDDMVNDLFIEAGATIKLHKINLIFTYMILGNYEAFNYRFINESEVRQYTQKISFHNILFTIGYEINIPDYIK